MPPSPCSNLCLCLKLRILRENSSPSLGFVGVEYFLPMLPSVRVWTDRASRFPSRILVRPPVCPFAPRFARLPPCTLLAPRFPGARAKTTSPWNSILPPFYVSAAPSFHRVLSFIFLMPNMKLKLISRFSRLKGILQMIVIGNSFHNSFFILPPPLPQVQSSKCCKFNQGARSPWFTFLYFEWPTKI